MTGPSYSAAEIAARFGLELRGDGETGISSVATLARAGAGQLAFLANPRYRNQLSESAASAVVMRADDAQGHAGTALVAADPYVAFAKIEIGRAHVCTPVTNAHLVCSLLLE